MKFFDPKKKEQNHSSYPPSAPAPVPPSPVVQPAPPTPTPPTPPSIPRPPAPATAETTTAMPADTAPTVMVPVPQAQPPASEPATVPVPEPPPPPLQKPVLVTQRLVPQTSTPTVIGSTVMIKGDVTANESLIVDGFIEGSIETTGDVNVGVHGKVYASVRADNIKVSGKVVGNITASNKVELDSTAVLEGNIRSPRLSISESALFRGSIDMRPVAPKDTADGQEKKPASSASVEPA